jgi:hypothetical protein
MGMQVTIWKEIVVAYSFLLTLPCWNWGKEDARRAKIKDGLLGTDLLLLLLLLLFTAVDFSLGGSSPYTSTDKTNKNKYTKRNSTKTQYKQYKA